jgi:hypothetical protein
VEILLFPFRASFFPLQSICTLLLFKLWGRTERDGRGTEGGRGGMKRRRKVGEIEGGGGGIPEVGKMGRGGGKRSKGEMDKDKVSMWWVWPTYSVLGICSGLYILFLQCFGDVLPSAPGFPRILSRQ